MRQRITRRELLAGGVKAGLGLAILNGVSLKGAPLIVFAEKAGAQADRFQAAYKRLDEFIARHMNDVGAPGMTLGLANRDGLLRASSYGLADLKTKTPVSAGTMFEIGSISKSFIAIAVLQLAEQGKLDLNKPITTYLPWLKIESSYAPITAHHLLSHTSGLSGVPLLMRVAATNLRAGFEPGKRFVYSNIGYVLLGFLLETVEERPLAEVVRTHVLGPLGMTTSAPIITNELRARLAIGYAPYYDDRPFPAHGRLGEAPWLEVPEAAGSIAATAGDMCAYLQMLLNRGLGPQGRLLSEKTFALFINPVIKAPFRDEDASYAYGLWVSDTNNHKLLRHTGGMIAFSSAMFADLTDGFAAFASVNVRLGGYRPVAVTKYALELLSAASNGKELPPLPPPPPPANKITNAADYAATFNSFDGTKLELASEGNQLILLHTGQRIVLEQAGRDRFIVKHPDFELFTLSFGREKNAVVEAFHGSSWWTNERYSGPKSFAYPKEWEVLTGAYRSDSPWYGSLRIVLRKGRLLLNGEAPLVQIEGGAFRFDGDSGTADRIVFDTMINGKAIHANYSGIDYYRTFTP